MLYHFLNSAIKKIDQKPIEVGVNDKAAYNI